MVTKFSHVSHSLFRIVYALEMLSLIKKTTIVHGFRPEWSLRRVTLVASELASFPDCFPNQVATIRHIRAHTQIPVARIYAYDNNLTNPIGSPYMLQEVVCKLNFMALISFSFFYSFKAKSWLISGMEWP